MPAFYASVYGRRVQAEAPSARGAAQVIARELYGNGMVVMTDPCDSSRFFLSHPHPRDWRPVAPTLRLVCLSSPGDIDA